jgi:alpha-L-rhamnosidase
MTTPVSPADFPTVRWHAHWIWAGDAPTIAGAPFGWDTEPRSEAHGLFRKSLTLSAVPPRVPARISAVSRYRLFVNGIEIGYGPPRSQPRRLRNGM